MKEKAGRKESDVGWELVLEPEDDSDTVELRRLTVLQSAVRMQR